MLPFGQRAHWIWSSEATHETPAPDRATPSHYQVRLFRRTFDVNSIKSARLTVHVSGDSRFVLYCNGERVSVGPAKGDVNHHFYQSHDLTPLLRKGRNVIAALVMDMSRVAHRPALLGAPCSVMTYAGGFLLQGDLERGEGQPPIALDTGLAGWLVAVDRAHRFQNDGTTFEGYLGYFEHLVSRELPSGWMRVEFDDAAWAPATTLYLAERLENRRDPTSPYGLVERMIPQLEEAAPRLFKEGFLPGGESPGADWTKLIAGGVPVRVPPKTKLTVILDAGELTTAFPRVTLQSRGDAKVRLAYAEALRLPWKTPNARLLGKQQSLANLASHYADESTGWTFDRRGKVTGWSDRWEPAEGAETFEPLHWRTFRYVGLEIETGETEALVQGVAYRFTAYPYEVTAEFTCSDPQLEKIFNVAVHTMRLCSHETFEDCPYYEQMQYVGDTMITSHVAMMTAGDYRLSRQALYHFDWSRLSDGLTQSRYPSRLVQIIPSWSLHWITNVRDYILCSGDLATARDLIPGMQAVLAWFRRHTDADGLPGSLPFWNITDWCPWWPRGVVPGADNGPTTIIASQYIIALTELGWILRQLGRPTEGDELEREAQRLRPLLHAKTWSETEGLYFDRPGGPEVSQYGNAWAIVAGLAGPRERQRILERFPLDAKLAPGSFFWWHTGFAALELCGRYDDMPRYLGPWLESVDAGLSTFVEENSYWRSLCHAWSAHPAIAFLTGVLGVRATAPGFAKVRIAPHRCGLEYAAGSVCTPRGKIDVSWRVADGKFHLSVEAPTGIEVTVQSPTGTTREFAGGTFSESFPLSA